MVAQLRPKMSCPEPATWQALLEGATPPDQTGDLAAHLEQCTTCRERLETLGGADDESSRLLREVGTPQPAAEPGLEEAMARLKEEGSRVESEPDDDGDRLLLGFLSPPEKPGQLGRLGHYDVLEVIGRGGMGIVLKAFDQNLQRVVAIKVLSPHLAASPAARKRFVREARAAAAIRNEHVIDIHSVEEANGLPYFVMGLIGGVSLQDRLDRSGPLELKEVLRIGMQMARGLAAAHALGTIHRDVKPANILLENGVERVKLTDFGLARAVDDASLTQSGVLAGTPQYMSPEQARGEPLDARSDLFSLGSVLYALCTGRPPFRAGSTMAVLKRICDDTIRDIRATDPTVPSWLVEIIERLHAKDPAARFQSATEVADLLARRLADLQQPGAIAADIAPRSTSRRRRRWGEVLILLGLAAIGTLWGPTIYRYATNQGELIIETNDPDVEVTVSQEGEQVTIVDKKSGRTVTLKAGRYRLELGDGAKGLTLSTERFTLERGDKRIVTVKLVPPSITEVWQLKGAPEGTTHKAALCLGDKAVLTGGGSVVKDGKWVQGNDFDLRLWDRASGKLLARMPGHKGPVLSLGISRDGKRAVSGGASRNKTDTDLSMRVWDLEKHKELRRFTKHTGRVMCTAFLPNGRQVISGGGTFEGDGAEMWLWDAETGEGIRQFKGHTHEIRWLAVLPDGKRFLSSGQDGVTILWDIETGEELQRMSGGDKSGGTGALAPNGRHVVLACWDRTIRSFDVETLTEVGRLAGHKGWPGAMAFTPDGRRLVAGSEGKTVHMWDVATGEEVGRFDGNFGEPSLVEGITADGKEALVNCFDGSLRLLSLPRN